MDSASAVDTLTTALVSGTNTTQSTSSSSNELGQEDFLLMLVTELMNQDPLDPLTDREFIAQLAQIETMNETAKLNDNVLTLQRLGAAALVGQNVEAIGSNGMSVVGEVTGVKYIDSEAWLVIDDTIAVNLDDVVQIL